MGAFKHISSAQSLHAETTDFSSGSEPPAAKNLPDKPRLKPPSVLPDKDRKPPLSLAQEAKQLAADLGGVYAGYYERLMANTEHDREWDDIAPESEINADHAGGSEPTDPDTIQPDSPDDWDNEPFEAPEVPNNPWDDEPPEMTSMPVYGSSPATLANNTDSQNARNSIPLNNAGVIADKTSSHSQLITESSPTVRGGAVGSHIKHIQTSDTDTRTTMSTRDRLGRATLASLNTQPFISDTSLISYLLDDENAIAYRKVYRTIAGNNNAALLLSQLMYWTRITDKKNPERRGWFYKNHAELIDETGLTDKEIKGAKSTLKRLGIIEVTSKGLPPVTWMRINKRVFYPVLVNAIKADIKAEEQAEEDRKRKKKNGVSDARMPMDNVPDWIAETEDFRDSKTPQNRATDQRNQHREQIGLYARDDLSSELSTQSSLLHTEITNKDYKQKKTTTTSEARAKISEPDFVNRVSEAMKTSEIPDYFVLEMASEIWEQYSTPRAAMAIKIIHNDWTASERKATRLHTQQDERQPALNEKQG